MGARADVRDWLRWLASYEPVVAGRSGQGRDERERRYEFYGPGGRWTAVVSFAPGHLCGAEEASGPDRIPTAAVASLQLAAPDGVELDCSGIFPVRWEGVLECWRAARQKRPHHEGGA
jgi:hypothetical protein